MKRIMVQITFDNGECTTKRGDSNDRITAMNMALNRLTDAERNTVKTVEIVSFNL